MTDVNSSYAAGGFRFLYRLRTFEPWLDRVLSHPSFSYALIGALQLKLVWSIWRFRDLTTGDTSSYFVSAYRWYTHGLVNIVWSPLYTAYYGTVLLATRGDVYLATNLHRLGIVMAATLGVLAVMRKLLPPALALLVAAWWAILPINFETLYEVHLFALLPILSAWLVTAIKDTPWTRGVALALLLGATILVRNEQMVAVLVFAAVCAVREWRQWRRERPVGARFWMARMAAYGLPVVGIALLGGIFYWRSLVQYPQMLAAADAKHMLNMCQVYAFGYRQRHPEWTFNAMTECKPLMKATFGLEWPTLGQMLWANPWATIEHFLWNASLTLNGFQVALFNSMSGTVNPDYAAVQRDVVVVAILTAVAAAIVMAGGYKLIREWSIWWPAWLRDRRGVLLIVLSEACVTIPVVLTQRPRPSYFFATTAAAMTVIAFANYVLLGDRRMIYAKAAALIVVPALVLTVPCYYSASASRPLYTQYLRLRPFVSEMAGSENRILLGDYSGELQNYLLLGDTGAATFDYGLLSSWREPQPLNEFLDAQKINIVFIQPRLMQELKGRRAARPLLSDPLAFGWRKLAPPDGESDWLLLYRPPRP